MHPQGDPANRFEMLRSVISPSGEAPSFRVQSQPSSQVEEHHQSRS